MNISQSVLPRSSMSCPIRQNGFAMLWLLFFIATLGIGMAALGVLWHSASQREKERELLFVGDQYRRALESYLKAASPGAAKAPKSLDDLLLDPRFPHTVRHLRRLYPDPITGKSDWGLLRDTHGGIVGIHSQSEKAPFKVDGFPAAYQDFAGKSEYRQWVYSAILQAAPSAKADGTESASVNPGSADANASNPAPVATPPLSVRDETQIARLACLQEKERVSSTECALLQGQAQQHCNTQAFQRYRACLNSL